jgi:hypothetical protein
MEIVQMLRRCARRAGLTFLVCAFLGCLSLGCGGDKTYRVSGKVTFKGNPVPAGQIYFIPDGAKGNSGATGFARIKDGTYDTDAEGGRGSAGGPMIIAIEGLDPSTAPAKADPSGEVTATVLFARYEVNEDLPKEATTKDFEVPASAAKGPVGPKTGVTIIP